MSLSIKQKDGRRWSVDAGGIKSLKRKYQVILDAVTGADGEAVSFTGIPAIGTAHPSYSYLFAESYDVEEGEGKDKKTLTVYVNYAQRTTETSGSGSSAVTSQVEEWGWESGYGERELTEGADGTAVLNSAGDTFDRVPTIVAPASTFTKVMKFKARRSDAAACDCKVNDSAITIGGRTYPVGSLLCHVAEKHIFGDPDWKYRYTIQLQFRTNPVKINGSETRTDIGWDVALLDAGMRQLNSKGELEMIKRLHPERKTLVEVTTPELLDGQGHAVNRSSGSTPNQYNIRFQAYERVSIPSWFYSEPT